MQVPCFLANKFHVCFNTRLHNFPSCSYDRAFTLRPLCPTCCIIHSVTFLLALFYKTCCDASPSELLDTILPMFVKLTSQEWLRLRAQGLPSPSDFTICFGCDAMFWRPPQHYFVALVHSQPFSVCLNAHLFSSLQFPEERNTQADANNQRRSIVNNHPFGKAKHVGSVFLS